LLHYLAYCVANGLPFLGFGTEKTKVAIFDLELSRNAIRRRLDRIRAAHDGVGNFDNIRICSIRGKARKFAQAIKDNSRPLQKLIKAEGIGFVIIDPVYKFLLGRDENSNGIVADILEDLTEFCEASGISVAYVHHHSKGNQSEKDARDRGAGAGAWSRDPDCLLDLTEQKEWTKENQVFCAEFTLRDFPPVESFVVRWEFPLLVPDQTGLDPTALKQRKKPGFAKKYSVMQLVKLVGDKLWKTAALKKRAFDETGMCKTVFYELLDEAKEKVLLVFDGQTETWERPRKISAEK
jgi:AAA domain